MGNRLIGTSLTPSTTTGSLLSPPAHRPVRSGFVFPGRWDHARSLLPPCICVQLCWSDTRCGFYQIDIQLYVTLGEWFLLRCVTIQPCAKRCRARRATRWPSDRPLDLVLAALLVQCACVVQPCKWVCAHAPPAMSNARSPRWLKHWMNWLMLSPLLYPASRAAAVNARTRMNGKQGLRSLYHIQALTSGFSYAVQFLLFGQRESSQRMVLCFPHACLLSPENGD